MEGVRAAGVSCFCGLFLGTSLRDSFPVGDGAFHDAWEHMMMLGIVAGASACVQAPLTVRGLGVCARLVASEVTLLAPSHAVRRCALLRHQERLGARDCRASLLVSVQVPIVKTERDHGLVS